VAALVLGVLRARTEARAAWTIADVEAISGEVYRRAPSYRDVLARVRPRSPDVVPALGIFEPRRTGHDGGDPKTPGPAGSGGDPGEDLLLFLTPKALAPRAGPRVTVVNLGERAAVLAGVRPFLDRSRTLFCFAPRTGASPDMGCADGSLLRAPEGPGSAGSPDGGPETPEERAYPALARVRDAFPPELLRRFEGVRQTIAVALTAQPGAAHRVALLGDGSGYRIEKVTGVRSRGELPGMRVVIEGGTEAGELVLGREDGGEPRASRYWMPALMEVPEDDAELARLLEDERAR
jgi:hypothetical protein